MPKPSPPPRDHTSGGADEEASDREEEAGAPVEDDNMGINPPEDEKPRSLSPCDQEVVTEPVQQLADESGDVVLEGDVPTVDALLHMRDLVRAMLTNT